MPFLSGTWPLCRIGRALGFGQVNLADKAVINLNVLPAGAVLVIAALMHDDFLNHFPQEGGGKFLKGKVLSQNVVFSKTKGLAIIKSRVRAGTRPPQAQCFLKHKKIWSARMNNAISSVGIIFLPIKKCYDYCYNSIIALSSICFWKL